MRLAALVRLWVFLVAALCSTLALAGTDGACVLQKDLDRQVAAKYPEMAVVTLNDLADDDRAFFVKDHKGDCPGFVNVDFYGDGKPTVAILLVSKGTKPKAKLVIAHRIGTQWAFRLLASDGVGAAIWRQGPGKYEDIYGEKSINAKYPVIVLCKYEAWAIVYSWTGTKVDKVWLSD
jgi:hypothetical protein